jgi:hypothetical protein
MNQSVAKEIADKYYINYGSVTFYPRGRGWNVRGYNCYDRVVEIFVRWDEV